LVDHPPIRRGFRDAGLPGIQQREGGGNHITVSTRGGGCQFGAAAPGGFDGGGEIGGETHDYP
jgi:hypothetical protein